MKRLFALCLTAFVLFSFASCEKSAKDVVRDFLCAVKNRDPDAETALLWLDETEKESFFYGLEGDSFDAYLELNRLSDLFPAYLASLAEKAEFSVTGAQDSGDRAAVTVRAVYADCRDLAASLIPQIRQEIMLQALNGNDLTLKEAGNLVLTRLIKEERAATERILTLELQKQNGEWRILPSPAVTSLCTFDLYTDSEAIFAALDKAG